MATSTTLVTEITGQVWIRSDDGTLTHFSEGMRVPVDAEIVTADGASVQLQGDGVPPVTIGGGRKVILRAEMIAPEVDPGLAAAGMPCNADATRVLTALGAGDPVDLLDPTEALIRGGDGDHDAWRFAHLAAVIETTTPLGPEYLPVLPSVEEAGPGGDQGKHVD